ncbi:hypothetical protein Dxin01_02741 [Deinococcus xinjiangensis]|uniref:Uncharacterized protein n=1 Tax=Deinococcus xinjiangensis TaxID=457454 RepID=A0ABP9VCN4_9DEIO
MPLSAPDSQRDESQATLLVVIRVAHKALTRYCYGDQDALARLSPQVVAWLEFHEYIAAVLDEEGNVQYEATPKGRRAVTVI